MSAMKHVTEFRAAVGTYEAALDAGEAGVIADSVVDGAAMWSIGREKRALKALVASKTDEPAELAEKFRVLAYLIEREIWEDLAVKLHSSATADFTACYREIMS
jgi:hypothetical protein